jgi:hypothetical protein
LLLGWSVWATVFFGLSVGITSFGLCGAGTDYRSASERNLTGGDAATAAGEGKEGDTMAGGGGQLVASAAAGSAITV